MIIYCCVCESNIEATLVSGKEVYPHRKDLSKLPFWRCDCGAFVGCHHKTKDFTRPLGVIPSDIIKDYRKRIHLVLDPIWKSGKKTRRALYKELTAILGRQYHTAELRTEDECILILNSLENISKEN